MCVCVCVCVLHFRQNCPREKKKLDVHINVYFVGFFFFASFYISNKYIIRSVKQVESMQRNLTESRSLNWERIARHQKAVTSFSYLST